MNHATTYHIGDTKNTRRKKTTTIEPTTQRVFLLDGPHTGCTGNQKRQKKICPRSYAPNGFLKTTFLPKLKIEDSIQAVQKTEHLERDFYISLSRLSAHYGINSLDTAEFGFPYNISLSLWDTKTKLKNMLSNFDDLQIITENDKTFLLTEERMRTGSTLYYIPVLPLSMMLKDKNRRKTALLLTSVCSYLYHVADIPYYRQEDSYLFWQYDLMSDWLEQDEENEYFESNKAELKQAEFTGDNIEQKVFNHKTLTAFENRLKGFTCKDDFDDQCLSIAKQAFALYTQYPQESVFRNSGPITGRSEDDQDYENDIISMDKYISFWADTDGWLADNLTECINNEFNEYGDIEEPSISKKFDGTALTGKDLDFESRLFGLLDDLIYLLNTYKQQRK